MALHFVQHRPTTAEINLDNLRHNVGEIRKRLRPGMQMVPVIKADAYGHGAVTCARALKGLGIKQLAVATIEEGLLLREAGITGDILVFGGLLCEDPTEAISAGLKFVIHQKEDLKRLGDFAGKHNITCGIHVKIDTGMGRLGFFPDAIPEITGLLRREDRLRLDGVFTHLARADEPDPQPTDLQMSRFEDVKKQFLEKGFAPPFYHIANSALLIDAKLDASVWVRPGLMLYGCYPHPRHREKIDLHPVMTLKTQVMGIKKHPIGSALSYGGTFVTDRESLIATLPIGYADGYPRLLSNRGQVLIRGQRAPVVGRVCMDLTLVDVTDISGVSVGDEVILIGKQDQQTVTAEEVATWAQTISYEIICGISGRVPRIYTGL